MTVAQEAVATLAQIRNELDRIQKIPRNKRPSAQSEVIRLRETVAQEVERFKRMEASASR
jgi:hypothetical protein